MTKTFFQRWEHWWCQKVPPHTLAIFRIAFGLFLFIEALTYIPAIPVLFSEQGITFSLWAHILPPSLAFLLEPPPASIATVIIILYLVACLMIAAGFAMRASLITLILLFLYEWQLSFHFFPSSYHRLFFVVLIVLLFSGAHKTFSVHMWRRAGSIFAWEPISILPVRLLSIQITAVYAGVGWQKIWLPDWQNGQILYYSFIGKWGSPSAFWIARFLPMWFYDILNWVVRLLECSLPVCLWMRGWRLYAFIAGTVFHVSIALLMEIWWFLVLPPAYILFLKPEAVLEWLHRRFPGHVPLKSTFSGQASIATSL